MKIISFNCIKIVLLFVFCFDFFLISAQTPIDDQYNCFTILVGKDVSNDGSVLLAHNEDDGGNQLVNWYKVPHLFHNPGEEIIIKNGAHIPQIPETYGYIWLEMPRMDFSDSYMNEWGVTITSNQCSSKESTGDYTDGGICYWLRRLMCERAKTAKEAVQIGGALIEQYGYVSSGRTYCIADPNEAWLMSVVRGRHWVAQSVPDDQIVTIPNFYIIGEIDLADTNNYLGSADIIDYAIERGWYDPVDSIPFNFSHAYGSTISFSSIHNKARRWCAVNILSGEQYDINDSLTFSFVPQNEVTVQDIISVLRNHYEGTTYETTGDPHNNNVMTICSSSNQNGFVAQLRNWMPVEIGSVFWIAPVRPCIQPFIPWYCGIDSIAEGYARNDYQTAIEEHFETTEDIYEHVPTLAFWAFVEFADYVGDDYENIIDEVHETINIEFEDTLFGDQADFENQVLLTYQTNTSEAIDQLTEFTAYWATKVWQNNILDVKELSGNFSLQMLRNYPNPFNTQTTIEYTVPSNAIIEIKIYNIIGQTVNTLLEGRKNKGKYYLTWNGTDEKGNKATSGVYFYSLILNGEKRYNNSTILIK